MNPAWQLADMIEQDAGASQVGVDPVRSLDRVADRADGQASGMVASLLDLARLDGPGWTGRDGRAGSGHAAPRMSYRPAGPANPGKDTGQEQRLDNAQRSCRHLGRVIWKRGTGNHRRRLAEARMRNLKLLGRRVMARDIVRLVAELQIRAATLDRSTALGAPFTQRAE